MISRLNDSFMLLFAAILLAAVVLVATAHDDTCHTDAQCMQQCRADNPTWTHEQCDAHLFIVPEEAR